MKMLVGGKKVDASDGRVMEVVNPFTHEVIDTVPEASRADVEAALDAAQRGKRIWASTPVHERAAILARYASLLSENREALAAMSSAEQGKPVSQSAGEVDAMIGTFQGYVEKAKHFYGLTLPEGTQPGTEGDISFTRHEPLGVVTCMVPFNFPLDLYSHKVAPALAAGNAVIIKPSSDTPRGAIRLTELLHEAGVPGDVAQVLTGKGSTVGPWLVSSQKIDAVTLTGSTEVGIEVAKQAAQNLRRVFLELGGNDPFIVFADADLDRAAEEAAMGRTFCSGQVCCAAKRFIIQNSVVDEFTDRLLAKLESCRLGDPFDPSTTMGPLISQRAASTVEDQIKHTLAQGARLVYGGKTHNKTLAEPTVLKDVTPSMEIAKDMEVFGPVFPIIGFSDVQEAIDIANSSIYGLCGGVMSADVATCMHVAAGLEVGMAVINGSGTYRTADIAFGGYKMSGSGREGVSVTLEEMTQVKTVVLKSVLPRQL